MLTLEPPPLTSPALRLSPFNPSLRTTVAPPSSPTFVRSLRSLNLSLRQRPPSPLFLPSPVTFLILPSTPNRSHRLPLETSPASPMALVSDYGEDTDTNTNYNHRFYEGRVDSFDRFRKTHKIVYNDGDVEELYLKNEDGKLGVD